MRVRELAQWLAATYEGEGERELTGVATLEAAGPGDLAFVGTRKAAQQAERRVGPAAGGTTATRPNLRALYRVAELSGSRQVVRSG